MQSGSKNTIDIGGLKVHPFVSSRFRLDGGSMFGVVPRLLWEKVAPPDSRGRIELTTNSLLIEVGKDLVLVETGMGDKHTDKWKDIYDLEEFGVVKGLAELGVLPSDVSLVILTHLHLDHAGGSTREDRDGRCIPVFPDAVYVVQEDEWRDAIDPYPLARDSYNEPDFLPLMEERLVRLVSGEVQLLPGIWVKRTGGHTSGHQIVRLESGGESGVYLGDIIPTVAHLRMNWIMAWDLYPTALWEKKALLLEKASQANTIVFWAHDPHLIGGRVELDSPGIYRVASGSETTI